MQFKSWQSYAGGGYAISNAAREQKSCEQVRKKIDKGMIQLIIQLSVVALGHEKKTFFLFALSLSLFSWGPAGEEIG